MLQKVSILSPLAGVPRCLILAATVFEAFIFNYYPVNPAYRGRLIFSCATGKNCSSVCYAVSLWNVLLGGYLSSEPCSRVSLFWCPA